MEPDDRQFDDEEPIGDDERAALQQDLVDVQVLKEILGTKDIKGVVFYCPDCDEDHYLAWDLLAGNLQELLSAGESPVHEPAYEPNPHDYVSWDYARGFLDGYESFEQEELGDAVLKLVLELKERGWRPDEVKALLAKVNLQVPMLDAPAREGPGDGNGS